MPVDSKPINLKPTDLKPVAKNEIKIEAQSLSDRGKLYEGRVTAAIKNPTGDDEMKNIYFGIVMGFSAIIPTAVHISCALFSLRLFLHGEKT
jgi:hypothetical protein